MQIAKCVSTRFVYTAIVHSASTLLLLDINTSIYLIINLVRIFNQILEIFNEWGAILKHQDEIDMRIRQENAE